MAGKLVHLLEKLGSSTIATDYDEGITEYDEGFIDGVMASFEGEMIDEKALVIDNINVKNHTKPGTAGEDAATIAKRIMGKNKTLRKAMAAIQFFINRRGTDLSSENFKNATAAQEIIAKAFAKKNKKKK